MPKSSLDLLHDLVVAKDLAGRAQSVPVKHGENAFGVGPVMGYLDNIIRAPFGGKPVLSVLDEHLRALLPGKKAEGPAAPAEMTPEDAAAELSPEDRAVLARMGVIPYPTEPGAPVAPVERASTFRDMHPLDALQHLADFDPSLHEHLQSTLDQYNSQREDGGFDTMEDVRALPAVPLVPSK